ncbi:hypothetical protein DO481_22335 [Salmonella enterica]|nr:hypothetical protein [Salmonella enterica]EIU7610232.1 hypothetical protein [Salmonella enterica]EJI4314075.1 hypothetical protein [Salmonella enterica]
MKLNKALLVLAAAGFLPGFAAHAAPVEATTTLTVAAPVSFQHKLTASEHIVAGKLSGDTVLATGLLSGDQDMTIVSLAWNRAVNPASGNFGADYAVLVRDGSSVFDPDSMVMAKLEPTTPAASHYEDSSKVIYTLPAPAPSFGYNIVAVNKEAGVSGTVIHAGSYKMAVSAEAFFA